jgi:hypothetical protein
MVTPVGEGTGEGPGAEAPSEGGGIAPAGEGPGSKLEIWVSPKEAHPQVAPPPPRPSAKPPSETKATPELEEQARRHLESAGNLRRKGDLRGALDQYRVAADLYGKLLSDGRDSSRIKLGKDTCEKGIRACQASLGE